jgi:hypothetical protein
VGTAIYFVLQPKKTCSKPPAIDESCPPGAHVGDPNYSWPHPELFLDESGFGEALETFGYDVGEWGQPGWMICSSTVRKQIAAFQRDYNLVRPTIQQPPTAALRKDGLIDDATAIAIRYVHGLQQTGLSWPLIVEETRGGAVS